MVFSESFPSKLAHPLTDKVESGSERTTTAVESIEKLPRRRNDEEEEHGEEELKELKSGKEEDIKDGKGKGAPVTEELEPMLREED